MANSTISIVMSVFNGECFLAEAIESIRNQSISDFEFIIINDGSTDKTPSILASYERKDARIRIINQEKRGLVDALNCGCAVASSRQSRASTW